MLVNLKAIQEKIELPEDMHASISQIEAGNGVSHQDARRDVLKRLER
jgi:hypothetical protein